MSNVARQGLAIMVGRASSALFQGIATALFARIASVQVFGRFAVLLIVISIGATAFDQGLENLNTRLIASSRLAEAARVRRQHTRNMLAFAAALTLVVPAYLSVSHQDLRATAPIVVWSVLERRVSFHVNGLIGQRRANAQIPPLLLMRMPACLIAVPAIAAHGALFAFSILNVLGLALGLATTRLSHAVLPPHPNETPRPSSELRTEARGFWKASISGQIRSMDLITIQPFVAQAQVNIYALPYRLVSPLRIVATSLTAAAIPHATSSNHEAIRKLVRRTSKTSMLLLIVTLLTSPLSPWIVTTVFGPEYRSATEPMVLLLIAVVIGIPGSVASGALQGLGDSRYVGHVGIFLIALHITLIVSFTALWGIMGAALTPILVNVIQNALVQIRLRKIAHESDAHRNTQYRPRHITHTS